MANLSIRHGNADASAVAYAYLNAVGPRFGEYAAGYRFGMVGLDLADKKGSIEPNPRLPQRRSMGRALGSAFARGSTAAPPRWNRLNTGDLFLTTRCGSTAAW